MLNPWIALISVALTTTAVGCNEQPRRLRVTSKAVAASASTDTMALADEDAGSKPKSRLSKAQKEAGKAYVNGWNGLDDEMPKNGKWSVAEKAD